MLIRLLGTVCLLAGVTSSFAQLTIPPNGGNKKASVSEQIGLTQVAIHYDRPGVKGREGNIWGKLVYTGYSDLHYGTSKSAPWRAGSNENTTIDFSTDVAIDGHPLAAGRYGFFIAYDAASPVIIFSKNSTSWGSYFYDASEDVLRVPVKTMPLDKSVEWLKYEFMNQTDSTATVALEWEKLAIPFTVSVDLVKTQLESFRKELRSEKGFDAKAFLQAANYCAMKGVNLDEAMVWADKAMMADFGGTKDFPSLSTKAGLLKLANRQSEADALMKEALPLGSMQDLHQYGRQLLAQKRNKEAMDVFAMNYKQHPNEFTTNMGMTRAYMAMGDNKKALEYAQKALPQAPDPENKKAVEGIIAGLKK